MADVSQLEINGTTYDICDATARDSLSQYVLKAGDTMTGELYIHKASPIIKFRDTDLIIDSTSNNHLKGNIYPGVKFYDSANNYTGMHDFVAYANGNIACRVVARNIDSSGNSIENSFQLSVNKNGTVSYYITSPAAFREAIGLGYYGRLSGLSANKTLTTTAAKMPLKNFNGIGCIESSNGIKFNAIGSFMIWGAVYISSGAAQNDIIHVQLRVNNTNVLDQLARCPGASPYEVFTVGPWIYYCSDASQVLSLYAYNQAQASGLVTDSNSTNLMAVKIA